MLVTDLIGAPFSDGGRGPESYDCWGLCVEVFRRHNIELPDYKICCHDSEGFQKMFAEDITGRERHGGDDIPVPSVVAIRFNSPFVNHVCVYIGDGRFLHTREKIGVCVERIDAPYWRHRIEGYYTCREPDHS